MESTLLGLPSAPPAALYNPLEPGLSLEHSLLARLAAADQRKHNTKSSRKKSSRIKVARMD